MRLYIIRHGETEWNQSMRLQGQTDVALNEGGRSLARVTARALHEVPFDLCFTSPLSRAKETAQLVLAGRAVPILEDDRIQEIGFGSGEGRRVRNAARKITDPVFYQFFHQPEQYVAPEGGESLDELLARTGAFLEELAAGRELIGKTILISTHGAASRALLANIRNCPKADFWDTGVPKNCAVTIVDRELEPARWVIREQDVVYGM